MHIKCTSFVLPVNQMPFDDCLHFRSYVLVIVQFYFVKMTNVRMHPLETFALLIDTAMTFWVPEIHFINGFIIGIAAKCGPLCG